MLWAHSGVWHYQASKDQPQSDPKVPIREMSTVPLYSYEVETVSHAIWD